MILILMLTLALGSAASATPDNLEMITATVAETANTSCASARLFQEVKRLIPYRQLHNCEIQVFEKQSPNDPDQWLLIIYARDLSRCHSEDCPKVTTNYVLSVPRSCLSEAAKGGRLEHSYGYQTEDHSLKKTMALQLDLFGNIYSLNISERISPGQDLLRRTYCRPEM